VDEAYRRRRYRHTWGVSRWTRRKT
jgi:hypothetical protein